MLTLRRLGAALFVPTALWLSACSDTGAPQSAEDAQVTLDVAQYAADATVDDIVMMTDGSAPAFTGPQAGPPFGSDLTFTREVTYYDADGAEMD